MRLFQVMRVLGVLFKAAYHVLPRSVTETGFSLSKTPRVLKTVQGKLKTQLNLVELLALKLWAG